MLFSPELPDPSSPSQTPSATRVSQLDRLELELQAVRKEALATQASIVQLQKQEDIGPYAQLMSDLPVVAISGTAMLGALAVFLTGALWWFLWQRPQRRLAAVWQPPATTAPPPPAAAPVEESHAPATQPPPVVQPDIFLDSLLDPAPWQEPQAAKPSQYTRRDPPKEFDRQSVVSDLQRVRESLAQKRAERARQREHDHEVSALASIDFLLPDDNAPESNADAAQAPQRNAWRKVAPVEPDAFDASQALPYELAPETLAPTLTYDEPAIDSGLHAHAFLPPQDPHTEDSTLPFEMVPEPEGEPQPDLDTEPSTAAEPEPEPEQEQELESESENSATHGYAVKLALAQESAALDLWQEARDLATEVLECDTPYLKFEANALLARLDKQEPDTSER